MFFFFYFSKSYYIILENCAVENLCMCLNYKYLLLKVQKELHENIKIKYLILLKNVKISRKSDKEWIQDNVWK